MSRYTDRQIPAPFLNDTAIMARARQADRLQEAEHFRLLKAARTPSDSSAVLQSSSQRLAMLCAIFTRLSTMWRGATSVLSRGSTNCAMLWRALRLSMHTVIRPPLSLRAQPHSQIK